MCWRVAIIFNRCNRLCLISRSSRSFSLKSNNCKVVLGSEGFPGPFVSRSKLSTEATFASLNSLILFSLIKSVNNLILSLPIEGSYLNPKPSSSGNVCKKGMSWQEQDCFCNSGSSDLLETKNQRFDFFLLKPEMSNGRSNR